MPLIPTKSLQPRYTSTHTHTHTVISFPALSLLQKQTLACKHMHMSSQHLLSHLVLLIFYCPLIYDISHQSHFVQRSVSACVSSVRVGWQSWECAGVIESSLHHADSLTLSPSSARNPSHLISHHLISSPLSVFSPVLILLSPRFSLTSLHCLSFSSPLLCSVAAVDSGKVKSGAVLTVDHHGLWKSHKYEWEITPQIMICLCV